MPGDNLFAILAMIRAELPGEQEFFMARLAAWPPAEDDEEEDE